MPHLAVAHRGAHFALGRAIERRASSASASDRDDIHQVASLRLMQRMRACPSVNVTPSYLHRMARNAVVDAARQNRARCQRDRDVLALGRPAARTPEDVVLDAELGETLAAHLERLSPARRDAVARYIRGERVPEIAAETGESPKRVENLVYRGLRTLRRTLTEAGLRPG